VTDRLPGYVVVSGPPGSGKTTLARLLAEELCLPLLSKDTIKEALMTVLEVPDVTQSQRVGRAAVAVLLAVAAESRSAVLESVWHRSYAVPDVTRLPGPVVEVFCRCDRDVAERRYRDRAGSRVAGHLDQERRPAELWNDEVAEPVAGGWPVLEVDTNSAPDVTQVAARVRAAMRSAAAR
jgi:predicted kinase